MRPLVLLAASTAALVLAAGSTAAPDAKSACQKLAEKQVALVKPKVKHLNGERFLVKPKDVAFALCADLTGDRLQDITLTVYSGGTAGDIAFVVLRRVGSAYRVALTGEGYKLGLARKGAEVIVTQPVYKKDDPNCCPTGGYDHVSYRWNGQKFAVARRWHDNSFRP